MRSSFQIARTRPRPHCTCPEDCIFAPTCRMVTLVLESTSLQGAHRTPNVIRCSVTDVRAPRSASQHGHRSPRRCRRRDAAAALMASYARPRKICSWGLAERVGRAARAVCCSRPSCTLHEMWVGVVLHTRAAVTIRWLWADFRGPV